MSKIVNIRNVKSLPKNFNLTEIKEIDNANKDKKVSSNENKNTPTNKCENTPPKKNENMFSTECRYIRHQYGKTYCFGQKNAPEVWCEGKQEKCSFTPPQFKPSYPEDYLSVKELVDTNNPDDAYVIMGFNVPSLSVLKDGEWVSDNIVLLGAKVNYCRTEISYNNRNITRKTMYMFCY